MDGAIQRAAGPESESRKADIKVFYINKREDI
jgi:hypothetical protein